MSNVMHRDIEQYVNETAAKFLTPINNVESVRCARRADNVFMELVHEDSYVRYFDISSMDISSIGMMIGRILSNEPVKREIQDRVVKKEVRRIFKMGDAK